MVGPRVAPEPLAPLCAGFVLRPHAPERLDKLLHGALGILERTGIKVLSPAALRLLADHGAAVDRDRQTVRLTPDLVTRALGAAPRPFVLASRDGSCDLDLSLRQTHFSVDGCAAEIVDVATGRRRPSTKADVAAITRVVDYLGGSTNER